MDQATFVEYQAKVAAATDISEIERLLEEYGVVPTRIARSMHKNAGFAGNLDLAKVAALHLATPAGQAWSERQPAVPVARFLDALDRQEAQA